MSDTNECINDLKDSIEILKAQAEDLREKSTLRKPVVIEFCGSPKSGKSTCIDAIKNVLRDCKYNVYVIHEKAKCCPIYNKFDPMFNFWTVTNTINDLMVQLDNNYAFSTSEKIDVILIDRGILDSLIWFKWLQSNNAISSKQYSRLYSMITMDRVKRSIDKTFIFKIDSEHSLLREPGSYYTENNSGIMNKDVLEGFNKAMSLTIRNYGKFFNHELIDISKSLVGFESDWAIQVGVVTKKVLEFVIEQYDEQVAFIQRDNLIIPHHSCVLDYKTFINNCNRFEFKNRVDVEDDYDCIQFIPIAVIIDDHSVLHVKKTRKSFNDSSKKLHPSERNKDLFYVGGHVRIEDANHNENDVLRIMRNALHREIKEEINLDLNIPSVEPTIIYSNEDGKSVQHIACCWIIRIGPQKSSIKTNGIELMKNNTTTNGFINFTDISSNLKLETWSRLILTKLLKDKIPKEKLQSIEQHWEQYSFF